MTPSLPSVVEQKLRAAANPTAGELRMAAVVQTYLAEIPPVLATHQDVELARETMRRAGVLASELETRAKTLAKPLTDLAKTVKAAPAELIADLEAAVKVCKDRLQRFEMERRREEQIRLAEAEASAAIEDGRTTPDLRPTAAVQVVAPAPKVSTYTHSEVKVVDQSLVPMDYFVVDMVKLRRDALAGVAIPGVVVVTEQRVRNA